MYRVMIVDDERAIRNVLINAIRWKDYDMEVVLQAESGIEAINTMDDYRPHVAFVDIRMPFMNGIEFSKLARDRYPHLKIVILTAYDEFEYAKECIGIGVWEYILKPIKREDIHKTLSVIKERLEKEREPEETEEPGEIAISQKILDYIGLHYAEEDINLTKAAIFFGYHPSYLSRRIKMETGKTFTEHLMHRRMEDAKKLAKKGMVMYLTARKVGITDPNYFSKCFKKYVGINYSEYSFDER